MNTKKSKFQEKLDTAVMNMKKKHLEEDRGSVNDEVKLHEDKFFTGATSEVSRKKTSQTAQPPNPFGIQKWISVKDVKPPCYFPINIWDGKEVQYNWHRVNYGDDYYANDVTIDIKTDVTHWSTPAEVIYPKYEPISAKDLPGYELTQIIKAMKKQQILYNCSEYANGYNEAIHDCIKIVERRLKKVSKDQKVKLHTLSNTGT
jgi:hypothetical protein